MVFEGVVAGLVTPDSVVLDKVSEVSGDCDGKGSG